MLAVLAHLREVHELELSANHYDDLYYHFGMAMTLRLPAELDDDLRAAAEEDRRSVHQTVVLAIELFLAARETAQVKADPEALRALAEARQAVRDGDARCLTEPKPYAACSVAAALRDRSLRTRNGTSGSSRARRTAAA